MSTNNKEPGATLAVVLNVAGLCVIGWTAVVPLVGLYYRLFRFLPLQFGVRTSHLRWEGLVRLPAMQMQHVLMGVLIGLVLLALAANLRAIHANTQELRKIKEDLRKVTSK